MIRSLVSFLGLYGISRSRDPFWEKLLKHRDPVTPSAIEWALIDELGNIATEWFACSDYGTAKLAILNMDLLGGIIRRKFSNDRDWQYALIKKNYLGKFGELTNLYPK